MLISDPSKTVEVLVEQDERPQQYFQRARQTLESMTSIVFVEVDGKVKVTFNLNQGVWIARIVRAGGQMIESRVVCNEDYSSVKFIN